MEYTRCTLCHAYLGLRGVVVSPELGHEVGGVARRVDRERLRDHQQRLCERSDRQLLAGTLQPTITLTTTK